MEICLTRLHVIYYFPISTQELEWILDLEIDKMRQRNDKIDCQKVFLLYLKLFYFIPYMSWSLKYIGNKIF